MPLYNLREDAATSEISRTQIWQWIHHPTGVLSDGRKVTVELFREIMAEELSRIRQALGSEACDAGKFPLAAELFDQLSTADELADFLTLPAYSYLE